MTIKETMKCYEDLQMPVESIIGIYHHISHNIDMNCHSVSQSYIDSTCDGRGNSKICADFIAINESRETEN